MALGNSLGKPAEGDLERAAQQVRELEQEALEMHHLAQRLNKEGRFSEAQAAYASMHQLEDLASALAAQVGCVACVLGDQQPEEASLCSLDPEALLPYQRLHPVPPWASAVELTAVAGLPCGLELGFDTGELTRRAVACIMGSALADAAAMGVHWVYDLAALEQYDRERRAQAAASPCTPTAATASPVPDSPPADAPPRHGLEFMDPPRAPFYTYPSGRNSPYGEQTLVLLRSLAGAPLGGAASGREGGGSDGGGGAGLDCGRYADLMAASFGADSGFDGYRDVSIKGFLRNFSRGMPPPLSGANDAQANCVARLAPLVAAFGGGAGAATPLLLTCVELATRVTQNTHAAVAWGAVGAEVLERLLVGASAEAAVRQVVEELRWPQGRLAPHVGSLAPELAVHLSRVLELRTTPVPEAVTTLGRNCHMPNALQTPLHVVLHVEYQYRRASGPEEMGPPGFLTRLPADAFVWGVRLAIREGGCCASRAAYVGACLGAMTAGAGEGLPAAWLAKYPMAEQVRQWAHAIMDAREEAGTSMQAAVDEENQ